ncbi:MAG: MerR family transcriptional regulator [Anaerolineae bacterium]|nr:MerR family transcriptional regulator [Anaerolineae bacterium]
MLKIGEFAALADMSIKTLRYYDDIGLLKPVAVDAETGYRYYDYTQLARAYRLSAFKNMGLALNEIAELLDGTMTAGPTRRFLRTKRADLADQLRVLQEQIAYLDNKIYEVEMDGRMAAYEVMVKRLEPMKVLIARGAAPLKQDVGATMAELRRRVEAYNAYPTAPIMAIFTSYIHPPTDIPIAVAQPTDSSVRLRGDAGVEEDILPAMTVAAVIHTGPYDMAPGWVALNEWIQRNGYTVAGPFREIFLHEDVTDSSKSAFELQFPIKKMEKPS